MCYWTQWTDQRALIGWNLMSHVSWHVNYWLMGRGLRFFLEKAFGSKVNRVTGACHSVLVMHSGWASHVCVIPQSWSCTRRTGAPCSVSLLGRDGCRRLRPEECFIVIASVTGCHSVITYTDIRWKLPALDSWAPRSNLPWSLNQGAGAAEGTIFIYVLPYGILISA